VEFIILKAKKTSFHSYTIHKYTKNTMRKHANVTKSTGQQ